MAEEYREALWPKMLDMDGAALELVVERVQVGHGVTFSAEAMEQLHDQMLVWVGTRVMRRWNTTHEPPSRLTVEITVTAS